MNIPTGYTDTLELTISNNKQDGFAFAKVLMKHPGGDPVPYEKFVVAKDGTTVEQWMAKYHPEKTMLSTRTILSCELPDTMPNEDRKRT